MQNWFFKYRLYHLPFWFAYHVIWLIINTGSFENSFEYLFNGAVPVKFYFYVIFQASAVYVNLYYLIPKFLYTGHYKIYLLLVSILILFCSLCIVTGSYAEAFLNNGPAPENIMKTFLTNAVPSTYGSMALAMSLKLAKNWLNAEKRKLILEKENVETELKYLKSQINPHFLFNTFNSIFVLIHKDPDLASESLASFSQMLRYQLYECNENRIPLSKDLDFLENFIELERLRLYENQTELKFEINHLSGQNIPIAPFILLPFIENAFKHVSKGSMQKNFITMDLSILDNNTLKMWIENSKSALHEPAEASGIGLKNVQRRLNLIYPGKHALIIKDSPRQYKIELTLDLK